MPIPMQRAPVSPADLRLDFESIRDRLSVRLLGLRHNVSYMDGKPYIDTGCGLALVAAIDCDNRASGEWFLTVTDELLRNEIKAGREELLTAALENTVRMKPAMLVCLEDFVRASHGHMIAVRNYLEGPEIDEYRKRSALMLSNESTFLGAAALFYPGVTERIAEVLGMETWVKIPSVPEGFAAMRIVHPQQPVNGLNPEDVFYAVDDLGTQTGYGFILYQQQPGLYPDCPVNIYFSLAGDPAS